MAEFAVVTGEVELPTNILCDHADKQAGGAQAGATSGSVAGRAERRALLRFARASLTLVLHPTQTADLIWHALPLHGIAETWGDSLHFDTPVRAGRDRTARLNARPGDVCFWSEDERIIIVWGPTPISRPNEIRLMRPCNVWAHVDGDAAGLSVVTPGEKVALQRLKQQIGRAP